MRTPKKSCHLHLSKLKIHVFKSVPLGEGRQQFILRKTHVVGGLATRFGIAQIRAVAAPVRRQGWRPPTRQPAPAPHCSRPRNTGTQLHCDPCSRSCSSPGSSASPNRTTLSPPPSCFARKLHQNKENFISLIVKNAHKFVC
jgi:hypothetical protein